MQYDAWPNLSALCPCCGGVACAIYRGYYTRFLFCPEMEFVGRLVIRTGYCRKTGRRFALMPDFLFSRLMISRLSQQALQDAFQLHSRRISQAIDELVADLGDEFYLPRTTAHTYLQYPKFPNPP